jgi:hypothetical protein
MNTLKELQTVKRDELLKIAKMMNVKTAKRNHEPEIISKILLQEDEKIYQALRNVRTEDLQRITTMMNKKKKVIKDDLGKEAVESAVKAIKMDYLMNASNVASKIESIAIMIKGPSGTTRELRGLCDQLATLDSTDLRPLHNAVQKVNTLVNDNEAKFGEMKTDLDDVILKMNETLVRSEGMKILEQRIREFHDSKDWKTLKTLFKVLEERLKNGNGKV